MIHARTMLVTTGSGNPNQDPVTRDMRLLSVPGGLDHNEWQSHRRVHARMHVRRPDILSIFPVCHLRPPSPFLTLQSCCHYICGDLHPKSMYRVDKVMKRNEITTPLLYVQSSVFKKTHSLDTSRAINNSLPFHDYLLCL
jgi:hypothetical protein